jgi:hypothetical protein
VLKKAAFIGMGAALFGAGIWQYINRRTLQSSE